MKTSELTDRALLQWADEEIGHQLETLAAVMKSDAKLRFPAVPGYYEGARDGRDQVYRETTAFLESLRNNIRRGT